MYFTVKFKDCERKFHVAFCHKDRKCKCEIWMLSGLPTNELEYQYQHSLVRGCVNEKHPETNSRVLVGKGIAECAKEDNYVKAYGRFLSLKRALIGMKDGKVDDKLGFEVDNGVIRQFFHELKKQCSHGVELAKYLEKLGDYNVVG